MAHLPITGVKTSVINDIFKNNFYGIEKIEVVLQQS